MTFTPKAWTNTPSTPINATSLAEMESRLSTYTDRNVHVDPAILNRLRVRNDFTNPRPATTTGWTSYTDGQGTGITSGIQPDTSFNEPGQTSGGSSYKVQSTYASGLSTVYVGILAADPIATAGVLMSSGSTRQIVYGRIRAKLVQGVAGPNNVITFAIVSYDGTNTQNRTVKRVERVSPGDVVDLDGFDLAHVNAIRAQISAYAGPMATTLSSGVTFELRAGLAQIVIDPATETPRYVSGSASGGTWGGTADASTSYAVLPRARSVVPPNFEIGFNDFASAYAFPDNPLYSDELAATLRDIGATCDRLPMPFTSLSTDTVGIYWPSTQTTPDYSNFRYKTILDAYRKAGIRCSWLIGGPPAWAAASGNTTATGSVTPWGMDTSYRARYAAAINALITLYPDVITAVEYNNEPNLSFSWGTFPTTNPDPALYMAGMTDLYNAIKAANPQVTFISGAPGDYWTTTDPTNMSAGVWLTGLYANGLKTSCDAVGIHIYPQEPSTADFIATPNPGTMPPATAGWGPGWDLVVRSFKTIMAANGDTKKLWLTESGINTGTGGIFTERIQAQYQMLTIMMLKNDPSFQGWTNNGLITQLSTASGQAGWSPIEQKTMRKRLSWFAIRNGKLPEADWIPLTLQNGWLVLNNQTPSYKFLPNGDVHLRGAVTGGSVAGSVIATLPVGAFPQNGFIFQGMSFNNTTTGTVLYQFSGGALYALVAGSTVQMYFDIIYTPTG